MSEKASALMRKAQVEKTKETVDLLVSWYARKEDFFKKYVPIQQSLINKILKAPETTLARLRDIAAIVSEEKELQALIFEKTEKTVLADEATFLPKIEEKPDPKDPKGTARLQAETPTWCNNIDRVLLSMSRCLKERKAKIKQVYKTLDSIHGEVVKEEGRYRGEVKREEKELERVWERFDDYEKESSKHLARVLKEGKVESIKESAFFIGELKGIESKLEGEFECFVARNKIIARLVQLVMRNEKAASKKAKEQLSAFLGYRRENGARESKAEEETWGFLAIAEERVEEERLKFFNTTLLRAERVEQLQMLQGKGEFKNNWQVIVGFVEMGKKDLMKCVGAPEEIDRLLKNISYRCWSGVWLAQGWLIESYVLVVLYMTYDSHMLIYSLEGDLLKKIHTSSSTVKKTEGQTLFLHEKIKGFFTDSNEDYKLKFDDVERMEEFQLFVENQVK